MTAAKPMAAQRGRSRSAYATSAAIPKSAMVAGSFMSTRMAGSEESVTVANAGWIVASAAHT